MPLAEVNQRQFRKGFKDLWLEKSRQKEANHGNQI
jgi:hypothetical protein